MGEIKSTLELAMERAEKIEVSPEEKEKIKREEYIAKAKGMANRYINEELNLKGLTKELDRFQGSPKDIIEETLILELVNIIDISLDNNRSMKAIETLKQNKFKPILDSIDRICLDFREEKERQQRKVGEELEEKLKEKLEGMKISGTAVQPKVDSDERWRHTLHSLTSEYEARLSKLKDELLQ